LDLTYVVVTTTPMVMSNPPPPSKSVREQQLAAALRANLRRRKAPKPMKQGRIAEAAEDYE
jgi:hypothetical protein